MNPHPFESDSTMAEEACAWLARRDRGLTPAEQDDYVQWLAADPRHAEAMVQHAAAFERMMKLYEWQPGQSGEPNPDLFASRRRWRPRLAAILSAAAAIALSATVWWQSLPSTATQLPPQSYLRVNERHALPDGSLVELKDGSRVSTDFSAGERRLRLSGEAHFKVAHDANRPFVVEASGVAIRALGTAFNVRIESDRVHVIVTQGSVAVRPAGPGEAAVVAAGERAVVNLSNREVPVVTRIEPAEVADALDWQAPRLQFLETPLGVALGEFNARNATQVRLAQEDLAAIPIGGTFRVDNVEGFVRVVEVILDLKADARTPGLIVLSRGR